MKWWNTMTEAERAQALRAAGWRRGGDYIPSAAEAWTAYQNRRRSRA